MRFSFHSLLVFADDRLDRFCSSACAFRHSHAIISPMSNKKTLKQLAGAFISYPPPATETTIIHHKSDPVISPRKPSPGVVAVLQQQIDATRAAVEVIKKRQRILQQAIARCEALSAPMAPANGDEVVAKKSKTKGSSMSTDNRPCGWERGLVWDDQEVLKWDGELGDEEGCTLPRRRCERHSG